MLARCCSTPGWDKPDGCRAALPATVRESCDKLLKQPARQSRSSEAPSAGITPGRRISDDAPPRFAGEDASRFLALLAPPKNLIIKWTQIKKRQTIIFDDDKGDLAIIS
jgi:hypothetical protein